MSIHLTHELVIEISIVNSMHYFYHWHSQQLLESTVQPQE